MRQFNIGDRPDILRALDPLNAVGFVFNHGFLALVILGSVFLAVTGAEALYSDMGHFGRTVCYHASTSAIQQRLWIAYKESSCNFYANGDWGREGKPSISRLAG